MIKTDTCVIGCEFAGIFSAFGADVHFIDSAERILGSEDADVSAFLSRAMVLNNVRVVPSCRSESVEVAAGVVHIRLSNSTEIDSECVLLAMGRIPRTEGLNLGAAGVRTDERGYIPTSSSMMTNVSHIYAVGDIGQRDSPMDMALVHVAQAEGRRAAQQILGEHAELSMEHIPYIIFTLPMVAGTGLSENAATAKFGKVRIGKYPYGRNHRAHAMGAPLGFVKLIVGPEGEDRILGIRVIGRDADTLVAAVSIMIEQGLPYTYLLDAILPHPSLVECLQGAAHIIAGDGLSFEQGEDYAIPL